MYSNISVTDGWHGSLGKKIAENIYSLVLWYHPDSKLAAHLTGMLLKFVIQKTSTSIQTIFKRN
jgi:hypothetical protein